MWNHKLWFWLNMAAVLEVNAWMLLEIYWEVSTSVDRKKWDWCFRTSSFSQAHNWIPASPASSCTIGPPYRQRISFTIYCGYLKPWILRNPIYSTQGGGTTARRRWDKDHKRVPLYVTADKWNCRYRSCGYGCLLYCFISPSGRRCQIGNAIWKWQRVLLKEPTTHLQLDDPQIILCKPNCSFKSKI